MPEDKNVRPAEKPEKPAAQKTAAKQSTAKETPEQTTAKAPEHMKEVPRMAQEALGMVETRGLTAAIEAADVVFMNSSVKAIGEAIRIAKVTGNIAVQNVVFALAVKALVMVMGFMGCANMWMAVFADTGVAMLCVLNSIRALYARTKK